MRKTDTKSSKMGLMIGPHFSFRHLGLGFDDGIGLGLSEGLHLWTFPVVGCWGQRGNVDFTVDMLQELYEFTRELNISRQAVIKSSLRQVLDQHHLAKKTRVG